MKLTGYLKAVSRDILSGRINFQVEMQEGYFGAFEGLQGQLLDVELKKHYNHRPDAANRLLWACLGQLAEVRGGSNWDLYLEMLRKYGTFTYACIKPNTVESFLKQWREAQVIGEIEINGEPATQILCFFGSSTYNTKEFSRLLDGVIQEMVNDGLNPPTTKEMKRVLELWNKNQSSQTT